MFFKPNSKQIFFYWIATQEKEEKSDTKRVILEDVIDVSEDEEDSDEELIFS